jgi:hypothetical protein
VPETLHTKNPLVLAAAAANQLTQPVPLLKPVTEEREEEEKKKRN